MNEIQPAGSESREENSSQKNLPQPCKIWWPSLRLLLFCSPVFNSLYFQYINILLYLERKVTYFMKMQPDVLVKIFDNAFFGGSKAPWQSHWAPSLRSQEVLDLVQTAFYTVQTRIDRGQACYPSIRQSPLNRFYPAFSNTSCSCSYVLSMQKSFGQEENDPQYFAGLPAKRT